MKYFITIFIFLLLPIITFGQANGTCNNSTHLVYGPTGPPYFGGDNCSTSPFTIGVLPIWYSNWSTDLGYTGAGIIFTNNVGLPEMRLTDGNTIPLHPGTDIVNNPSGADEEKNWGYQDSMVSVSGNSDGLRQYWFLTSNFTNNSSICSGKAFCVQSLQCSQLDSFACQNYNASYSSNPLLTIGNEAPMSQTTKYYVYALQPTTNCPGSYCAIVQYNFTQCVATGQCYYMSGLTPTAGRYTQNTIYDFSAPGNCLANSTAQSFNGTWNGQLSITSDDAVFQVSYSMNQFSNGGQDTGTITAIYTWNSSTSAISTSTNVSIPAGCRIYNTGTAASTYTPSGGLNNRGAWSVGTQALGPNGNCGSVNVSAGGIVTWTSTTGVPNCTGTTGFTSTTNAIQIGGGTTTPIGAVYPVTYTDANHLAITSGWGGTGYSGLPFITGIPAGWTVGDYGYQAPINMINCGGVAGACSSAYTIHDSNGTRGPLWGFISAYFSLNGCTSTCPRDSNAQYYWLFNQNPATYPNVAAGNFTGQGHSGKMNLGLSHEIGKTTQVVYTPVLTSAGQFGGPYTPATSDFYVVCDNGLVSNLQDCPSSSLLLNPNVPSPGYMDMHDSTVNSNLYDTNPVILASSVEASTNYISNGNRQNNGCGGLYPYWSPTTPPDCTGFNPFTGAGIGEVMATQVSETPGSSAANAACAYANTAPALPTGSSLSNSAPGATGIPCTNTSTVNGPMPIVRLGLCYISSVSNIFNALQCTLDVSQTGYFYTVTSDGMGAFGCGPTCAPVNIIGIVGNGTKVTFTTQMATGVANVYNPGVNQLVTLGTLPAPWNVLSGMQVQLTASGATSFSIANTTNVTACSGSCGTVTNTLVVGGLDFYGGNTYTTGNIITPQAGNSHNYTYVLDASTTGCVADTPVTWIPGTVIDGGGCQWNYYGIQNARSDVFIGATFPAGTSTVSFMTISGKKIKIASDNTVIQ
jgi:hypothetical protein